jgi:hypothetical protein
MEHFLYCCTYRRREGRWDKHYLHQRHLEGTAGRASLTFAARPREDETVWCGGRNAAAYVTHSVLPCCSAVCLNAFPGTAAFHFPACLFSSVSEELGLAWWLRVDGGFIFCNAAAIFARRQAAAWRRRRVSLYLSCHTRFLHRALRACYRTGAWA